MIVGYRKDARMCFMNILIKIFVCISYYDIKQWKYIHTSSTPRYDNRISSAVVQQNQLNGPTKRTPFKFQIRVESILTLHDIISKATENIIRVYHNFIVRVHDEDSTFFVKQ